MNKMVILGIETSCDETSIGILKDGRIAANLVATQEKIHTPYGGVVPELASRAHLLYIDALFLKAMEKASVAPGDIDAIGVTNSPGLKGSLIIGVSFACGLATALGIPLYMVNHLYAHIASSFLDPEMSFPAVGLVVSGGHTTFFHMNGPVDFKVAGETVDDACGETFDKVGRMLGLDFPGGPNVEREALKGDENRIRFPVPLLSPGSLDFSFSGLKTSVLYYSRKNGPGRNVADICAGFQKAVGDVLEEKARRALVKYRPRSMIVGGGVIQNGYIRNRLRKVASEKGVRLFIPPVDLCMDNGAMVALMTYFLAVAGAPPSPKKISVIPT